MNCRIHGTGESETREAKYGLKKRPARGLGAGRAARAALCAVALWAMTGSASALRHMTLQYTWGTFAFAFDSDQQREELSARGDFAPQNSTPFDVDVDSHSGRVFLSFPAILPGSQVALATIKDKEKRDSPQLVPYPDWSWHAGQRECDGLTSVFRIFIDKCRRLWVIDSGVVDIGNTFQHKCPAQLLAFDLKTDELLVRHRFTVPDEYSGSSLMLNVIAEQLGGSCSDNVYAYVADSGSYAIYVFSLRSQRSWRVESDTFRPDSNASQFEINGTRITLFDGVLALAQNDKDLYYHSFTSFQEGKVLKSVLRDEALFINRTNRASEEFKFIGSRANQSAGEVLAKNSVLFFHQMGTDAIYCWDTSTEYTRDNQHVVEQDHTLLHFVTSMKTIWKGSCEEVWAIDNNGQRLFAGEFQPNQPQAVNVVRGSVSDLSSKCTGRWYIWFFEIFKITWW